ncbi:EamA family transporter [Thermanaerothrix sp.]|uniref:EamA family transporter n=1 Tax=Thermanaerothrix sp. TaxID=2972675 RepID=UPI003C7E7D79
MNALLLALLSALGGALANLMARSILRQTSLRAIFGLNFALIFAWLLPFAPFYFSLAVSPPALGWLALAIGLDAAANYAYFQSFAHLDALTASTLLALSPFFTLLAAPFLSPIAPPLGWFQILGVVLCGGAVLVLTQAQNAATSLLHARPHPAPSALAYPLVAAALFGLSLYPTQHLFAAGYTNPPTYYLIRAAVIALLAWPLSRPRWHGLPAGLVRRLALRAAVVIAQWLVLLYALEGAAPAVVKALADTSPLFVLGLSLWRGEKPTRTQVLSALAVVLGVALLWLGGR